MAFRSSATAFSTGGGTITATPAGVQAGDYLFLGLTDDSNGAADLGANVPTGYTQRANVGITLQEQQGIWAADKVATGSDSFSWSGTSSSLLAMVAVALSGRNQSAPRTALQGTVNDTSLATPFSANMTGVTAAAGDDLLYFVVSDPGHIDETWSYAGISGWTNLVQLFDNTDSFWMNLQYKENVSAGATGTIGATVTRTAGVTNMLGYGGVLVAVAADPPPPPVLTGCRLLQDGTTNRVLQGGTGGRILQAGAGAESCDSGSPPTVVPTRLLMGIGAGVRVVSALTNREPTSRRGVFRRVLAALLGPGRT